MTSMTQEMVSGGDDVGVCDDWLVDRVVDWSLDGDWGVDSHIMNDLSDRDLWLNLGDLWNNLGMGSDWGQDIFLGHKWSKITSLRCSNQSGGGSDDMLLNGNGCWSCCDWDGGTGFDNFSVSDDSSWSWGGGDWSWSGGDDLLLNGDWCSDNVLLDGNGLKGWSSKVWDGWFDDVR